MANPSRFAGWYNAVEYAYGCAPQLPAALKVDIGISAAATAAVTLAFGFTTLGDGTILFPLNTNAPVNVGIGTNQETVTPTGISNNGSTQYDGVSFTAVFANAHGTGDPVQSGTFGLQEAINAANAAGGGVVVVDARWFTLGGTQAIIDAAVLPASGSVAILNNAAGGGGVQNMTVLVPNASVLTLFSVGTQLLPAPGAGNAYDVIDMVVENVYKTGAYTLGGAIQVSYGTGVTTPATATIAATFLTSPTANQMIKVAGALASSLSSAVVNKALTLVCATQDFASGAGSLVVKLSYRLLAGF